MDTFIKRSKKERLEIIGQTAQSLGMTPAAVEKDFWVCWILQRLFASPLKKSIIFKGGTSLSKVYRLIKRFSEDIDLILNWSSFQVQTDWNPGEKYGKSNREKMLKELDEWNIRRIVEEILPIVRQCCEPICNATWYPERPETIIITYPRCLEYEYIRREVLLEIGPKAAWNPHEEHVIVPYIAEAYPHLFRHTEARVMVTTAERAFWEKITILHAQAMRQSPLPKRYARHYYDTVMMFRNRDLRDRAFADVRLLYQVSSFKYYFYRAGWADYPKAVPGTLHLMPQGHILKELEDDYLEMSKEMLSADAPKFDELLDDIQMLETEANKLAPLDLDVKNYPTMEQQGKGENV